MNFLTEQQRHALTQLGEPVRFPPDRTIFWQGQPSRSALLIQQGHVKVTQPSPEEGESDVILAIRGPVELMGEEGVLNDEVRDATVTTITEVAGLDIAGDKLLTFVDDQQLWRLMYRAAIRRRRQADQASVLARLNHKSRLARWLLELATDVGEKADEGWSIETTLSQSDIAGRIGASRDTVATVLGQFRKAGWLTVSARTGSRPRISRYVLHDLEALRRVSQP